MGNRDDMGGQERYEARQRLLTTGALCVGVLAIVGVIVAFGALAFWVVNAIKSV
jgi:hypothetical protein